MARYSTAAERVSVRDTCATRCATEQDEALVLSSLACACSTPPHCSNRLAQPRRLRVCVAGGQRLASHVRASRVAMSYMHSRYPAASQSPSELPDAGRYIDHTRRVRGCWRTRDCRRTGDVTLPTARQCSVRDRARSTARAVHGTETCRARPDSTGRSLHGRTDSPLVMARAGSVVRRGSEMAALTAPAAASPARSIDLACMSSA
jgi:hypothetical protein